MNMKNFTLKTLFGKAALLMLFTVISANLRSQCSSSFNYTIGANGHVSFMSTSTSPGPIAFHIWKFDDSTYTAGPSINYTFSTPGLHHIRLYTGDSLSCWSSVHDSLVIQPFCFASVAFSMVKDSLQPQTSTWNAYPAYSSNIVSATWSWGDGNTSNGLFPSHTYATPGIYMICVTVTASCGDTASYCLSSNVYRQSENANMVSVHVIDQHTTATGLKQYAATINSAAVYPNPASDRASLSIQSAAKNIYKLELFNVAGKLVMSDIINMEPGVTNAELNTAPLESGLYLISISNGAEHKTLRFIKE